MVYSFSGRACLQPNYLASVVEFSKILTPIFAYFVIPFTFFIFENFENPVVDFSRSFQLFWMLILTAFFWVIFVIRSKENFFYFDNRLFGLSILALMRFVSFCIQECGSDAPFEVIGYNCANLYILLYARTARGANLKVRGTGNKEWLGMIIAGVFSAGPSIEANSKVLSKSKFGDVFLLASFAITLTTVGSVSKRIFDLVRQKSHSKLDREYLFAYAALIVATCIRLLINTLEILIISPSDVQCNGFGPYYSINTLLPFLIGPNSRLDISLLMDVVLIFFPGVYTVSVNGRGTDFWKKTVACIFFILVLGQLSFSLIRFTLEHSRSQALVQSWLTQGHFLTFFLFTRYYFAIGYLALILSILCIDHRVSQAIFSSIFSRRFPSLTGIHRTLAVFLAAFTLFHVVSHLYLMTNVKTFNFTDVASSNFSSNSSFQAPSIYEGVQNLLVTYVPGVTEILMAVCILCLCRTGCAIRSARSIAPLSTSLL